MEYETLDDTCERFRPENSSSVILLPSLGGFKALFTGDADSVALTQAADYAAMQLGIDLSNLNLLQVPHRGSRHNVGRTILNRIRARHAIISAAPEGAPKHPSRRVTNALIRRGTEVCATLGNSIRFFNSRLPLRRNWGTVPLIPFHEKFEI
jgi:beta-lactamase superfamily II metal-dependent hydrolase